MSPRARFTTRNEQDDIRVNINRSSVIAVAVSDYSTLPKLAGTRNDLKMVDEIFNTNRQVSLYNSKYISFLNPTSNQFRKAILEYTLSRSARGDILIFYFSGHGAILGTNEFAFCLKDTSFGIDESKILALSTVNFREVVQTLSAVDVFPVFIIDSCFSGLTAPQGTITVIDQMHEFLRRYYASSYALLASTSLDTQAFETAFGGFFTRALHSLSINGLDDEKGRHMPFLTLNALSSPLQEKLAKDGHPLSKCYIGPDMPPVAIVKNTKFRPDTEKFLPYFKRIIEYAWNNGNPRPITNAELLANAGRGAYANHSKLSRQPWGLLEDGKDNSIRVLTERGIRFAKGEIKIPDVIIRDALTWNWIPAPDSKMITINDIK
jgi:hypothetical protein